jgi:hypothetical protein
MKLALSIQTKQTTKLFNGKYKYKIVLVTKTASWFRGADLEHVKTMTAVQDMSTHAHWARTITTTEIEYAVKLTSAMQKMTDFIIRIESPYINFYTNNKADIEKLAKVNVDSVKYVSVPTPGSEANLEDKKIIVKNLDYDYRVTMGRTRQNYNNFLQWCSGKDKVKLTKRASSQLSKEHSWGGYYFYVKDEKSLTMVKMFLSSNIQNVEQCVKQ